MQLSLLEHGGPRVVNTPQIESMKGKLDLLNNVWGDNGDHLTGFDVVPERLLTSLILEDLKFSHVPLQPSVS